MSVTYAPSNHVWYLGKHVCKFYISRTHGFTRGQWVPTGMVIGKKLYPQMGSGRVTGKTKFTVTGDELEVPITITHICHQ